MAYVVSGLPVEPFEALFGLSDEELAAKGVVRVVAADDGAYPCRVLLEDAKPGESLLLLNYEHLPVDSPYRARHAIFVKEGADKPRSFVDQMPDILATRRLIALRAYDEPGMMVDADVVPGSEVEAVALRLLENPDVAYIHTHNVARGCYAARIDRG